MTIKKIVFSMACIVGILSIVLFFAKDFNLSWVEVNENRATVTINFLMPMDQASFNQSIRIENNPLYDTNYAYEVKWLNSRTCLITLTEETKITGQPITLHIQKAPTIYKQLSKSLSIPVQFKSDVQIEMTEKDLLIATNQGFCITFNTPMKEQKIHKYIHSDAEFIIEPQTKTTPTNETIKDLTTYIITPKEPLQNDTCYVLSLRKGMPAESGMLLEKDQKIVVTTDKKPQITQVTPSDQSKWIGLYPRIIVESSTAMEKAYMTIDNEHIEGKLKNPYYAVFYPKRCLKPNTTYKLETTIQSATGETSNPVNTEFTTVPIKSDRVWVEIVSTGKQELNVYKGSEKIKNFICSAGDKENATPLGTYYIQSKNDSYVSEKYKYGANYCTELTEGLMVHGIMRNEHWQINSKSHSQLGSGQKSVNIILKDEDAQWIYENIPYDAMVIIRPCENE